MSKRDSKKTGTWENVTTWEAPLVVWEAPDIDWGKYPTWEDKETKIKKDEER